MAYKTFKPNNTLNKEHDVFTRALAVMKIDKLTFSFLILCSLIGASWIHIDYLMVRFTAYPYFATSVILFFIASLVVLVIGLVTKRSNTRNIGLTGLAGILLLAVSMTISFYISDILKKEITLRQIQNLELIKKELGQYPAEIPNGQKNLIEFIYKYYPSENRYSIGYRIATITNYYDSNKKEWQYYAIM